jgi:hypothetical protein
VEKKKLNDKSSWKPLVTLFGQEPYQFPAIENERNAKVMSFGFWQMLRFLAKAKLDLSCTTFGIPTSITLI